MKNVAVAPKTNACRHCLAGRCGRVYHCVECGRKCCSHTIRPQTPRGQPEVGRCSTCIHKLMALKPRVVK
jgi:hypothetical protein